MSDKVESSMTASELKSRLYQTFKQRGWDDALKVQLRKKLVAELQQSALQRDFKPVNETAKETPLTLRVVNSLIADHLKRCQYEYSLSVFLPESETSRDKMFTVQDLLELLHVQPESTLFKKLAREIPYYEAKGFLWQLLVELVSVYGRTSVDKVIQVDELPAYQNSIEKKLSEVDNHYNIMDGERRLRGEQALQERMMVVQRELEAKIRAEMNTELSRYKATELKRIELDLREKSRKEITDARSEMESALHARMSSAEAREKAADERSRQQQQVLEQETYNQRQNLLQQLRELQQRETDLKREAEVNARAAKLEEDKRKAIEDNLKFRESSVTNIEQNYDRKFQEQVKSLQLDEDIRWKERIHDVEKKEKLLKEERVRLAEERTSVQITNDELKTKTKEITELQEQLQEVRSKVMSETHRNQMLSEKLRSVVDYPMVKEDNAVLRRELENTKMRLAETASEGKAEKRRSEEMIKQLTEKMSRPSPEMITLRGELERARDHLKQERALLIRKEEHWQRKVQEEAQRNSDLRHQLDQQTRQMQEMVQEMGSLRTLLRDTQRALHNEVYRRNDTTTSRRDGDHRQSVLADNLQDGPGMESLSQGPLDDNHSFGPIRAQLLDDLERSPSSVHSTDFMGETRARMRQLEMEAEALNRNYQEFQQRLGEPASSPYKNTEAAETSRGTSHPPGTEDLGVQLGGGLLEVRMGTEQSIRHLNTPDLEFDGSSQFLSLEEAAGSRRRSRRILFKQDPEKDDNTRGSEAQRMLSADGERSHATRMHRQDGGSFNLHSPHDILTRQGIAGGREWDGVQDSNDGRDVPGHSKRMTADNTVTNDVTGRIGYRDAERPRGHSGAVHGQATNVDLGGTHTMREGGGSGGSGHFENRSGGPGQRDGADGREHEETQGVVVGLGVQEEERRMQDGKQDWGSDGLPRGAHREDTSKGGGESSGSPKDVLGEERKQREEQELREWEEERQRREDERRRKDEEARERERQMLLELQKREASGQQQVEPSREDERSAEQERGAAQPTKPEAGTEQTLDPLMAKYMEMAQQSKDGEPSEQREASELSTGELSQGSISGDDSQDSPIAGDGSKTEDPFEDW